MRNTLQWFMAIFLITLGGMLFGVLGLAVGGVVTGWLTNSRKLGIGIAGLVAAFFWGSAASFKVLSGQSQPLLALAGAVANLAGTKAWLLVVGSALIAFFAGGLGGWLGGSLRRMSGRNA